MHDAGSEKEPKGSTAQSPPDGFAHSLCTGLPEQTGGLLNMPKYVFVTGGVVSGLGKGITAASLGRLLKPRGYKVTIQK